MKNRFMIYTAIVTKVLPATQNKPTRIKAFCLRGSYVMTTSLCSDAMEHIKAVEHLTSRFATEDYNKYNINIGENSWRKAREVGQLPNGDYVHVFRNNE